MKQFLIQWTLSHAPDQITAPRDPIPAQVPGAVQLDYAAAFSYPPYTYGCNFRQYDWMEDEYFFYDSELDFALHAGEKALLCFDGIDYRYEIALGGQTVARGEGAFTPISIDVTPYAGTKTPLRVTVFPIPKREGAIVRDRVQASVSCKPPSSYEWDWHPRLVPSGIWGEAYVDILQIGAVRSLEASYRLREDLRQVTIEVSGKVNGDGEVAVTLTDPDGAIAAQHLCRAESGRVFCKFALENPRLWYPRGYGDQPRYTLKVGDAVRKIGFRRSRLLLNEGAQKFEATFPKGPMASPMQLEINGQRVFVKGSNWVNTEIFPCLATPERYDALIDLALGANLNLFRLWGGQYINHEHFYDRCDEVGIMLWQEFMLSCNAYPDEDAYLSVLKQEATTVIKRLRTHPCLAFWCGGNELFNSWSGMTNQSHALRLLDSLCYEHDRFTPFQMTSPMHGVSHGTYTKAVIPGSDGAHSDYERGEEYLVQVKRHMSTAYTEFGCNGGAPREYITKYIMSEADYQSCSPENEVWVAHHAFDAWGKANWLGIPDVMFYFGSYRDVDDLVEKSIYLQDMCYQTMFEEMRRQAPLCSMAVNWDFNEPWPCAAGNSLVRWPAEPKSCLARVGQALRPTLLSLESEKNRYLTGDSFNGTVWVLNDSPTAAAPCKAEIWLVCGEERTLLQTVHTESVEARGNGRFASFSFPITEGIPERFSVEVTCAENAEISSVYTFVHKIHS